MIKLERIDDIYNPNKFSLHEVVLNEIGSFVFIKNRKGEYLYANQLTLDLFETTLDNLKGKTDSDFFHPDLLTDILRSDSMVFEQAQTIVNEERAQALPDGKVKIYRAIKKPIFSVLTNQVIGLLGVSTDITDLVNMREQLIEQANTDELTKLCNRRRLWEFLADSYQSAKLHSFPLSCIIIDIDHFKQVNDEYGHDFGDNVIVDLANIIRHNLRKSDCCGRIGGEEFLIVLNHTAVEEAYQIAERLRTQFLQSSLNNKNKPFSLSCGVTQLQSNDSEYLDLYRRADNALYKAKHQGRNQSILE
jgi:diguanylate cyclase (GGDEF)-like protein/PAS domain S-box-containing protein